MLKTLNSSTILLPDANITLANKTEEGSVEQSSNFLAFFENLFGERLLAKDDYKWLNDYSQFISEIINRRCARVEKWLNANLQPYQQDHQEVVQTNQELEKEIIQLKQRWTLCEKACNNKGCTLPCLKNKHQDSEHNCMTDHKCHSPCDFVDDHEEGDELPPCHHPAGHVGKHVCELNHTCTHECKYRAKKGCLKRCAGEDSHEGDHLCQAKEHFCGKKCSLSASKLYKCTGLCVTPCEEDHDVHKCESRGCPIVCCIDGCKRLCQSLDHLHALEAGSREDHMCG